MGEQFSVSFILKLVDSISTPLVKVGAAFDDINKKYESMGGGMRAMGERMTKGITAPIVALGGYALFEARKIDEAFLDVQDRFEGTGEELKKLKHELGGIAMASPHAKEELLALSATGLQIGVAKDKLAEFSKMMADFGMTAGMSGSSAAEALKELVMTTGDGYEGYQKILSVTTKLGDSANTSAARVLETTRQIAPIAKDMGMSTSAMQATAAWMTSMGQDAGMQISALMEKMREAAKFGRSANLPIFAHLFGGSTADFQASMKNSPEETLAKLLQRVQQLKEAGADVGTDLGNLGLGGTRQVILMARLGKSTDEYMRLIKLAREERERDSALTEDAARRYNTFGGQLAMLRHTQAELGEQLGAVLVPVLKELVGVLRDFAAGFANLPDWMKQGIVGFAGLAAAIGPVTVGLGMLSGSLGVLGIAAAPVAALGVAFAAIAAALYEITKHWQTLKEGGFVAMMKDMGGWVFGAGTSNDEGRRAVDEIMGENTPTAGWGGGSKHEVTIKLLDPRLGVGDVNRKEGKAKLSVDSPAFGQFMAPSH